MKLIKNLLTTTIAMLALLPTQAQEPERVANINSIASSYLPSFSQQMTVVNGKAFFKFIQGGDELGVYDGETLTSFDGPGDPKDFTAVGDRVYFTARRSDIGTELWMYENGEVTEIDINNGSADSNPIGLTALNGSLYFQANDGIHGKELWKHDGTTATLIDIIDGATGSEPVWLTTYNNELIFFADDGVIGFELYKYDETEVTLIDDIADGATGSALSLSTRDPYFEEFDGTLYFRAYNGAFFKLFAYDGTDVIDQNLRSNGSSPKYMTTFNSKLYLYGTLDNETGVELIEFDGTSASVVEDLNEGSESSGISPQTKDFKFATTSTHLYFEATDGVNSYDLYSFDGTSISRIPTNTDNSDLSGNSFSEFFGVSNDKLYFQSYGGTNTGVELWEHDGTNLTEIVIRTGEESSSVRHMTDLDGDLYFTANDGDGTKDWFLWKYDGTSPSFISNNGQTEPSDPYELITLGDKVYFSADDGIHGRELWSSDGVTTELVIDQLPGDSDSEPYALRVIGDQLFYFGYTEDDGAMYIYDGTSFETFNQSGDNDGAFIAFNGEVYFQGYSYELGGELYKYDGIEVTLVADIREGSNSSYPSEFFVWNSELYFSAADNTHGRELWKYDGNSASLVQDINPIASSRPSRFTEVGSDLYFVATTSDEGQEVAKYDGTSVTIIDIYDGSTASSPNYLVEYDGKLVLGAESDVFGDEVIIIDSENNIEVLDINTSGDSYPSDLFVFKDKLYFRAQNDAFGEELWVYDGEAFESLDLVDGNAPSNPTSFFELGPYMYLGGFLDENPYGMLRYDGVGEPEFLGAIEPEVDSEGDYPLAILDNYAYFNAGDEFNDSELYRIRRIETENDITAFTLNQQLGEATIDANSHTIAIDVVFNTDVTSLDPTIAISDYAEIDLSGVQDFTDPVVYTVTSEYGETQLWTVTVTVAENSIPTLENSFSDLTEDTGFSSMLVSYANAFADADGHPLTITVSSSNTSVVTAALSTDNNIQITEVGIGSSTITLTASDDFGGSISDEFLFTVTEAPLSLEEAPSISVYPNPASRLIQIDSEKSLNVVLIDLKGDRIRSDVGRNIQMDIQELPVGIYLLKIVEGNRSVTHRIIKTN